MLACGSIACSNLFLFSFSMPLVVLRSNSYTIDDVLNISLFSFVVYINLDLGFPVALANKRWQLGACDANFFFPFSLFFPCPFLSLIYTYVLFQKLFFFSLLLRQLIFFLLFPFRRCPTGQVPRVLGR